MGKIGLTDLGITGEGVAALSMRDLVVELELAAQDNPITDIEEGRAMKEDQ